MTMRWFGCPCLVEKLAVIQRSPASCGPHLAALCFTLIVAVALDSGVALGMGHRGGGSGSASTLKRPDDEEGSASRQRTPTSRHRPPDGHIPRRQRG